MRECERLAPPVLQAPEARERIVERGLRLLEVAVGAGDPGQVVERVGDRLGAGEAVKEEDRLLQKIRGWPFGPSSSRHSPKVTPSKNGVSSSGTASSSARASSTRARAAALSPRYHGSVADACVAAASKRWSSRRRASASASAKSASASARWTYWANMACW